jgi:hypothetical protein
MADPDGEALDLSRVPFAAWLEEILPQVCRQDAKAIAIICLNRDGTMGTGYYNAVAGDKGAMAWQLLLDGVWDMLIANKGRLREELEAAGEEPDTDAG